VAVNWGDSSGRRIEQVRLVTDDATTGTIALRVSGHIQGVPSPLSPKSIHFGGLRRGQSGDRIVRVQSVHHPQLQITGVEFSSERVSIVRIGQDGEPDPSLPLEGPSGPFQVTFACDDCGGRQAESVIFHTTLAASPRQTLTVTADVALPFDVSPPSVFFSAGEHNAVREIRISADARAFSAATVPELHLLSSDGASLPFHIAPLQSAEGATSWRIKIILRENGDRSVLHRAVLRVTMDLDHVDVPIVVAGWKGVSDNE
jgi:hypothetical protein